MDIEKTTRDGFTLTACLLYGFLFGYMISGAMYQGEIRLNLIAAGFAFGYALKVLLFR